MAEVQDPIKKTTETVRIKGFMPFYLMLEDLKKNKKDFVTVVSSNTRSLTVEQVTVKEKYLFSDDFFPMGLMHYVKKIKEDIAWHREHILLSEIKANPFDVEYYDFAPGIYEMGKVKNSQDQYAEDENTAIYEADISMCYYVTAFKLGFMSEYMFNECLNLPKKHRLKLLGAIATSKTKRYYENGVCVHSEVLEDEFLRAAWFKICYYVGQAMQTIKDALGKRFLFYWVDGIYFTYPKNDPTPVEDLIKDISKHLFFTWKIQPIYSLRISNQYGKLEIRTIDKKGDPEEDYRFFYPPKKKIIAYRDSSFDIMDI